MKSRRDASRDTDELKRFLRTYLADDFPAADFKNPTGVPKALVGRYLRNQPDVQIFKKRGKTHYQYKQPQSTGAAVA